MIQSKSIYFSKYVIKMKLQFYAFVKEKTLLIILNMVTHTFYSLFLSLDN